MCAWTFCLCGWCILFLFSYASWVGCLYNFFHNPHIERYNSIHVIHWHRTIVPRENSPFKRLFAISCCVSHRMFSSELSPFNGLLVPFWVASGDAQPTADGWWTPNAIFFCSFCYITDIKHECREKNYTQKLL